MKFLYCFQKAVFVILCLFVAVSFGQYQWTQRSPIPTDANINSVIWANNQYVAVGSGGAILTSPNGSTWTRRVVDSKNELFDVAYNGSILVAVGTISILTSSDGISWTKQSSPNYSLNGICWSGSQFIAVGDGGYIATSVNGTSWVQRTTSYNSSLKSVISSSMLTVAIGMSGTILTSSDGFSWTSRSIQTRHLKSIVWTGYFFVGVGDSVVVSSPDGVMWSAYNQSGRLFTDIAWTGSDYCAVGVKQFPASGPIGSFNADAYFSATYASTWTEVIPALSPSICPLVSLAFHSGNFVAGGWYGTLKTSNNGTSWNDVSGGRLFNFNSVAMSTSGLLVAVGGNGAIVNGGEVWKSQDGLSWTKVATPSSGNLTSVLFDGSQFVAGGANSILTSADGQTWTSRLSNTGSTTFYLRSVTMNANRYVACGYEADHIGGTAKLILTSPDGITWSKCTVPNTGLSVALNSITSNGSKFIASGSRGYIHSSVDGITWSLESQSLGGDVSKIYWDGSRFIAVTFSKLFTSVNGQTWTETTTSTPIYNISSIVKGGTSYVAVGINGDLRTSSDAITWERQKTPIARYLFDVLFTGSQYVAVGEVGSIITAPIGTPTSIRSLKSVKSNSSNLISIAPTSSGRVQISFYSQKPQSLSYSIVDAMGRKIVPGRGTIKNILR
jgi:hypothetical protein